MFKRIDRSPLLGKWIERLSMFLARRRGLPVVIGIFLVIVSFILQIWDVYALSQPLHIVAIVFQNLGILIALVGLLLAEPLGK